MKKISFALLLVICLIFSLIGCSKNSAMSEPTDVESSITIAAAASLKNCMDEKLIPLFQEKNQKIKVQATYDSSGKLQSQIEEGAPVDVFISAAMKQMTALDEQGLILEDSIVKLLENKIVLIVPANNSMEIKTFEDILKAKTIAIGDPESVPAGQYAKELLTNLKIWDQAVEKASLGTNVTEVLNWVAEGSADVGIVYSTDAASNQKVKIVAEAAEGTVSKVIYPVGMIKAASNQAGATRFMDFLNTDEALKIFESYGFTANK